MRNYANPRPSSVNYEQLGLPRRELRNTGFNMLPASGQNSATSSRHDMTIGSHATSQETLGQTRRQLRNTGNHITDPESNIRTGARCCHGNYLICLAVCACLACCFTGAWGIYFAHRRKKFLAKGNRTQAKKYSFLATVFIVLSFVLFPVVWYFLSSL